MFKVMISRFMFVLCGVWIEVVMIMFSIVIMNISGSIG